MDASAPEWVHLFALGKMTARDGGAFDLADAEGLKRDFDARRVDLPVDYEHESETALPDRTGPVPAAGWIKELRVDARGLWGRVEWTEQARELIGAKACRYPSPAPNHRRGNNVMTRLKGAGLFHHPDLERTALASQEDTMADDPAKDRAEPDDGTMMQRMIAMLKLPDDTDAKTLMKGVEEMLSNGSKPDPAKFVPIEVMQELLHDRGRQAATRGGSRAVQQVGEAFRRGDPTTPMRDWATALCRSDEAAFDAFIATSVPMSRHPTRPTGTGAQAPQHLADAAVSEIETAICGQLGLKPGSLIA